MQKAKNSLIILFFIFIALAFSQLAIANNNILKRDNDGILEVVIFTSKPSYTNEQILKRANAVTSILKACPGFLSRKLSANVKKNHEWIDIIHWSSLQDALEAANKVTSTPQMNNFISIMKSYKMYHFQISLKAGE